MDAVTRARSCVGARFRLQGRDPATGLDCVGLAAFAFGITPPPADYALRGGDGAAFVTAITAAGMRPVSDAGLRSCEGALWMVMPAARHFHLAVLARDSFIHADARLRRVVEVPGVPPWPVIAAWRAD